MAVADDVEVKINWHELRVLCIWARWHADRVTDEEGPRDQMQKTVAAIVRRLQGQFPEKTALSLAGEVAEIPGAELYANGVVVAAGPKKDNN